MRFFYTLIACTLLVSLGMAQVPNYPAVIGLNFQNHSLIPVSVVPASGQSQPLSSQPTSTDHFLSGNSTLDVANQIYYYVSSLPARLFGFNLTSGQLQYNILLPRDSVTQYPLSAIQYHPKDSLIYGIRQQTNGLYFVSFDPTNGQMTTISNQPIAQAIHHAGDATIDTATNTFYLPWGNKNSMMAAIDISTGQAQTIMVNDPLPSANTISRILNVQFNHADGYIYGLHFSSGALRFVKLDPSTGQTSLITTGPISGDHFQVGNCTFDLQNQVYYYTRVPWGRSEIIAVDVATGQVLAAPMIQSSNTHSTFVNPEFNPLAQPVARFMTTLDCDNTSVEFGNQSIGSRFEWDFGDGTTSTAIHPKHQYAQPGTYQVTLKAHAHQQTHMFTHQVEVRPPLDIEITGADSFFVGDRITLSANAGMSTYQWNTGHQNASSIMLTHGGTYTVTVTHQGCTSTASKQVRNVKPFEMDKSQVLTTSYEKEFSSDLMLSNPTANTLTYQIHMTNQGHFPTTILARKPSTSGDITIKSQHNNAYELTIPPFSSGTLHANWYAQTSGVGRSSMIMQHPFGGVMEEVEFIGIAKVLTSTQQPSQLKELVGYPNPVQSGGTIQWSEQLPDNGRVFDMQGRLIGQVSKGDRSTIMPDSPGLYFIQLNSGERFSFSVIR